MTEHEPDAGKRQRFFERVVEPSMADYETIEYVLRKLGEVEVAEAFATDNRSLLFQYLNYHHGIRPSAAGRMPPAEVLALLRSDLERRLAAKRPDAERPESVAAERPRKKRGRRGRKGIPGREDRWTFYEARREEGLSTEEIGSRWLNLRREDVETIKRLRRKFGIDFAEYPRLEIGHPRLEEINHHFGEWLRKTWDDRPDDVADLRE